MTSSAAGNGSYPMPPANADLATAWAYLEEGVDQIMAKPEAGVPYARYMSLCTVSYNCSTRSSKTHGTGDQGGGMGRILICALPLVAQSMTAGANPMILRRGLEKGLEAVITEIKAMSKQVETPEEIAQLLESYCICG